MDAQQDYFTAWEDVHKSLGWGLVTHLDGAISLLVRSEKAMRGLLDRVNELEKKLK